MNDESPVEPEASGGPPVEPPAGAPHEPPPPRRRIAIGSQRAVLSPPAAAATTPPATAQVAASTPPASPPAARPPRRKSAPAGGGPAPAGGGKVEVPNLRQPLDEDLESEFEEAVGGLEVEALLAGAAAEKIDAPLAPGTRLSGTVVSLGGETAFVDLGGRRQGALPLASLSPEEMPAVGEVIDISVGSRNEEDGLYEVAAANHAVAVEDWSQLEVGMIVEGRVTGTNKGGLEVDVGGLRGFMPAGAVSTWRVENFEEFVGQTLECLVTELVPAARRLVLSRRAVMERQAAEARAKLLETLEVGQTIEGTVRSMRDFGAFVDIGNGVDGLVHVSQLSWERVAKPEDLLEVGQRVRVVVKKIDRQTGKIGLSARDLVESPWQRAEEKYPVGATKRGTVSRIAQFGAFVRLEPGVEGLVHVSELAHRHVRSVADVVAEGEEVECRVLSVDPEAQRISLSIKALATPPAKEAAGDEAAGEADTDTEPAAPPRRSNRPLKGGLGRGSTGEQFGLKW